MRTLYAGRTFTHEMDGYGNHRLTEGTNIAGWTPYNCLAVLVRADHTLVYAATDYFARLLPTERPFTITLLDQDTLATDHQLR